ncbi:MAG: hypothetical protein ACK5ZH_00490, partial [Alphaproteobacteria bacterium]
PASPAASVPSDAGPLFVSPKAELPRERTLYTAAAPEFEEEQIAQEAVGVASGGGLFGRLASVSKAFAAAKSESRTREVQVSSPALETSRRAEVRDVADVAAEEGEMYDIPAFLRRQAN